MKKIIVIFLILVSHNAFSQPKSHVIKINLGSLAVKNFALQYEQAVGKRTSVALGLRFQPYGDLPFQQYIKDHVNDQDVQVSNIKLGNFALTPEFRYYFKQSLKGFYIAPYARFASYKMETPVTYQSTLSQKTAFFTGDIQSFSGGVLIGNQFNLGKNITLDFWIIGAHFGGSNGKLQFTASLNAQEQEDIRQTLKNADIPFFDIQYDINSNGGTITSKGAWAGFRGLALNLGIRF